MVAFELSAAHLLNVVMLNKLSPSQVHLLIPRPLEPKDVRFPIWAWAHSLISLLPLHSRPYQPFQVTTSHLISRQDQYQNLMRIGTWKIRRIQ
jgi:hypothetical protein